MSLTSLKDIDREVLKHIDDDQLLRICSIDRKTWNEVCDDNFLRRRLTIKYPGIEKYKKKNESWKRFFLRVIYYISKLKEDFKFNYTTGNFKKQFDILKSDDVIFEAAVKGELSIIKYMNEEGINVFPALEIASAAGQLDMVKYLVEKGADIDADVLILASQRGHLDIVKYLVEHGADIHARDDESLIEAIFWGHFDIVKYLVEQGANIHAQNNLPLILARESKSSRILEYLEAL